jgi:hypothetical protein
MADGKFSKALSRAEAKHRYVHIPKDGRNFFPEAHEPFAVKYDGKEFEMKVNHKDDIMTGQLYHSHKFFEGTVLTFESKKDGTYSLVADGAEKW